MTTTQAPTLTCKHVFIVFDFIHVPVTAVSVDYSTGWQCYLAFGVHEAETAVKLGALLPVKAARVVFPSRVARPYLYSDRREKLP